MEVAEDLLLGELLRLALILLVGDAVADMVVLAVHV